MHLNEYIQKLLSYLIHCQVSTFLPPYIQTVLSWPKRFGGTLGLEECCKRGGISGRTCWLAAVVEDSCVISGKLVQSSLGWEISAKLVERASM